MIRRILSNGPFAIRNLQHCSLFVLGATLPIKIMMTCIATVKAIWMITMTMMMMLQGFRSCKTLPEGINLMEKLGKKLPGRSDVELWV